MGKFQKELNHHHQKKIIIPTDLPSKEEKENLNDDLFHQKLLVENIDEDTRDLSQEYFYLQRNISVN